MITKMSFAHLKESDLAKLSVRLGDASYREIAVAALKGYLQLWSHNAWIDKEKLYFIGRDLSKVSDATTKVYIRAQMKEGVQAEVAKIFLEGFDAASSIAETSVQKPMTIASLEKRLKGLAPLGATESRNTVEELIKHYQTYADLSGNVALLLRSITKFAHLLLRAPSEHRLWAGRQLQGMARHALVWAPSDDYLWTLWARSLAQSGDLEASELVYWEALRQFPWNAYAHSQLIEVLKAQKRAPLALTLAETATAAFPGNRTIKVQYANLLKDSTLESRFEIAAKLLVESMHKEEIRNFYEETVLAASIVQAEKDEIVTDGMLEYIYDTLSIRPERLAGVVRALIGLRQGSKSALSLFRFKGKNIEADNLIEQLIHTLAPAIEDATSENPRDERLTTTSVSDDEFTPLSLYQDPASATADVLPPDVISLGSVRKLRFNLETGRANIQTRQLLASFANAADLRPATSYAKLIAFRYDIAQPEEFPMTSFAFSFEEALRDEDKVKLDLLAERFPRLAALTIVAKAMFGDEKAALKIQNLLTANESSLHPAALSLKRRMRNHLDLIIGGKPVGDVISAHKTDLRSALYDANEATLHVTPQVA